MKMDGATLHLRSGQSCYLDIQFIRETLGLEACRYWDLGSSTQSWILPFSNRLVSQEDIGDILSDSIWGVLNQRLLGHGWL